MGGKGKASGVGALALALTALALLLSACGGSSGDSGGGSAAEEQDAVNTAAREYLATDPASEAKEKCSFYAKERLESLKRLANFSSQIKTTDCAATVEALAAEGFVKTVPVKSIRSTSVKGDSATVTFVGQEKEVLKIELRKEPGGWKIFSLTPKSVS